MVCAHRHCAWSAGKARLHLVLSSTCGHPTTQLDTAMLTIAHCMMFLEAKQHDAGAEVADPERRRVCRPQLVKGFMQLYSVEQKRSQALEAHAAAFSTIKVTSRQRGKPFRQRHSRQHMEWMSYAAFRAGLTW